MKIALRIALALALVTTSVASYSEVIEDKPSVGAMMADAILVRPVYFVLSQIGALAYTVTLPFTLLGGNTDEAAETMVVTPLQATFVRCLGCGSIPTQVDGLERGFGKEITHFVELQSGMSHMAMPGASADAMPIGLNVGTHFELIGGSRFDVMLGAAQLGEFDYTDSVGKVSDGLMSYQIVTRFGREVFTRTSLMLKFGLNNWSVTREDKTSGAKATIDGYGYLYGAGVDVKLTNYLHSGLEFTRYKLDSNKYGYESGVNVTTLNLSFHF
ncbi:MAG: hypothetical protein ACPGYX_06290 [Oceanobacter sp.]